MAACQNVVDAFRSLRDSLSTLAGNTTHSARKPVLRQRSFVAGELAEQCAEKLRGQDVPGGDDAIMKAQSAKTLADRADQTDAQIIEAITAATGANTALHDIVRATAAEGNARFGLRGALRVSPRPHDMNAAARDAAPTGAAETEEAQPPYLASVALLFPIEAATLFPIARGIATSEDAAAGAYGPAYILVLMIALIVGFIIFIRYFATQQEHGSPPVWREIAIAVISFLLWAGALGGYWVSDGGFETSLSGNTASQIFAFITIMWVAMAPYLVRKPSAPAIDPNG